MYKSYTCTSRSYTQVLGDDAPTSPFPAALGFSPAPPSAADWSPQD